MEGKRNKPSKNELVINKTLELIYVILLAIIDYLAWEKYSLFKR